MDFNDNDDKETNEDEIVYHVDLKTMGMQVKCQNKQKKNDP